MLQEKQDEVAFEFDFRGVKNLRYLTSVTHNPKFFFQGCRSSFIHFDVMMDCTAPSFKELHLRQMIFDACKNKVKIVFIVNEIEMVAFNNEERTKFVAGDPIFIQDIQCFKVRSLNTLFEIPTPF